MPGTIGPQITQGATAYLKTTVRARAFLRSRIAKTCTSGQIRWSKLGYAPERKCFETTKSANIDRLLSAKPEGNESFTARCARSLDKNPTIVPMTCCCVLEDPTGWW
jgi:hypothetical protein